MDTTNTEALDVWRHANQKVGDAFLALRAGELIEAEALLRKALDHLDRLHVYLESGYF
jgi:hypothetical protein